MSSTRAGTPPLGIVAAVMQGGSGKALYARRIHPRDSARRYDNTKTLLLAIAEDENEPRSVCEDRRKGLRPGSWTECRSF